jgi:HK97 gp10 family phage protein
VANSIKISGLRELGERMRNLSDDINKKVARQAVAAGAKIVRDDARRRAPKDTGNLQAAIVMKNLGKTKMTARYVVATRSGKTADVKAGKAAARSGEKDQRKLVGKDAFYGAFVEFGTVKMPARPFMRPAIDDNTQAATDAIAKRLRQRIERAERKK